APAGPGPAGPPPTVFPAGPGDRRGQEALLLVRFHDYLLIDDVRADELPRGAEPRPGGGDPAFISVAVVCGQRGLVLRPHDPGHAVGGPPRAGRLRRHRPERHAGHGPAAGGRSCRPPLKLATWTRRDRRGGGALMPGAGGPEARPH